MKRFLRSVVNAFGYDISRMHTTRFSIDGIHYEVDPCSVGETPQGEMTARAAIRMIKERQFKELTILDMCCGVGIIGLTMFSNLRKDRIVREMIFADINVFNLNSLGRTLAINELDHLVGKEIRLYLSDGLSHIPTEEQFDLIISNPPHYLGGRFRKERIALSPRRLGTYDPDWNFHKSFYGQCHSYLRERGEVWFLENGSVADESDFVRFIEANQNLKYEMKISEPLNRRFFWMITGRA